MPKLASAAIEAFISRLERLERTRSRVERRFAESLLARRDVEQLYEGMYLNIVKSFEEFIEDLFLGLLAGRYEGRASIRPLMSFKSERVARKVVFGGKSYVDWLPYSDFTQKRARLFFSRGEPFCRLDDDDRNFLRKALIIRNAIAHTSRFSQEEFQQHIIGNSPLLPNEKTPPGFLRSLIGAPPSDSQFQAFAAEFANLGRTLCR